MQQPVLPVYLILRRIKGPVKRQTGCPVLKNPILAVFQPEKLLGKHRDAVLIPLHHKMLVCFWVHAEHGKVIN